MSAKERPNLNAVGLTVDIITSLDKHIRGPAANAGVSKVLVLLDDDIKQFVENINESLNLYFGK